MIGVVQFTALLADNCGTQSDVALQDFLALLTPLHWQVFNLRFPMPDNAIFTKWSLFADIGLCGMGGVDLLEQARSDVGLIFESNVVIGAIGWTAVAVHRYTSCFCCRAIPNGVMS